MARFSVSAIFRVIDRISAPIARMQRHLARFARRAGAGLDALNRRFTALASTVSGFASAFVLATGVMGSALAGAAATGADFEQTIVNAAAKFPGEIQKGTDAFKQLELAARQTGSTTEFSASQSAEALNFMAMAGFNAQQSIAALPGVVDLATAASVELGEATDIASDALGAFGLMAKDDAELKKNLATVSDVMAKTTTTANTNMRMMFETIKEGAPVAITAGSDIFTFSALTGELANSGIKASQAGTTLKNVFLQLAAPTAEGAALLQRLGVATADSDGNMRDVIDVLGDLNGSLEGLGTAEKSGVLEGIFGKIPIAGVNILLKSGTARLKEYREELKNSEGAASRMAKLMRDTVQGRLKSLGSAFESVKISIFTLNKGPLADAITKTTELVRANEALIATKVSEFLGHIINNFSEIVQKGRQIAGVIAAYILLTSALKVAALAVSLFSIANAALGLVLGTVTGAVAAYQLIVTGLPKALALAKVAVLAFNLALAANPVGVVVVAVGSLIALAAGLITAWGPVTEFFSDLWGRISEVIAGAAGALRRFGKFFGFTDEELDVAQAPPTQTTTVSPQERTAALVKEVNTTNSVEVTLKDDTGKAQVTQGQAGGAFLFEPTGVF